MAEKRLLTDKEIAERVELIDELVSKGGPTVGYIKVNQDTKKVARLIELGWQLPDAEPEPEATGKRKITAMMISTAETVGLTQAEIIACEDAEALEAAIKNHPDGGVAIYRTDGKEILIPQTLYVRAKEKVGMTNEMMATYPDIESLKKACDRIHPKSNPDAYPKQGEAPKSVKYEDNMPDKFEVDSMMEAKFISQNRAQFDEANLQDELRRINRKYGAHNPVKIVKTTTFNQIRGMNKDRIACKVLVTKFEIYFK